MEIQSVPFPGKSQPLKLKTNRSITEGRKINAKEPPIHRQRRAFGTIRNTNVAAKTVPEKPMVKPSIGVSQKQRKSVQTSPSINNLPSEAAAKKSPSLSNLPSETAAKKSPSINNFPSEAATKKSPSINNLPSEAKAKKSPEKSKARPKNKTVRFKENVVEKSAKALQEEDIGGLRTPVRSPSLIKAGDSGTPYHSAEICSKCRFDKLETSSYWLAQIKLAESVGKHFVSASFFRLAFESNAEPIGRLGVEIKQYLARHEYLSAESEWRGVCLSYGLMKDESIAGGGVDLSLAKTNTDDDNAICSVLLDQQSEDTS